MWRIVFHNLWRICPKNFSTWQIFVYTGTARDKYEVWDRQPQMFWLDAMQCLNLIQRKPSWETFFGKSVNKINTKSFLLSKYIVNQCQIYSNYNFTIWSIFLPAKCRDLKDINFWNTFFTPQSFITSLKMWQAWHGMWSTCLALLMARPCSLRPEEAEGKVSLSERKDISQQIHCFEGECFLCNGWSWCWCPW